MVSHGWPVMTWVVGIAPQRRRLVGSCGNMCKDVKLVKTRRNRAHLRWRSRLDVWGLSEGAEYQHTPTE